MAPFRSYGAWLFAVICAVSFHLSRCDCPSGWVRIGETPPSSYCVKLLSSLRKNFTGASDYCKNQEGGYLVRITSSTIQTALKPQVIAAKNAPTAPGSFWIGLTDNSSTWFWAGGPNLGSYTQFVNGSSNHIGKKDCVYIRSDESDILWHVTADCTQNKAFICQRDFSNTVPVSTTIQAPLNCPNSWAASAQLNTCIRLYISPTASWPEARQKCQDASADLVKIDSSDMNNFVIGQINAQKGVYWIGLHDRHQENRFEWLDQDSVTTYTNWKNGYPNNGLGGNENCVAADGNRGSTWDDRPCNDTNRYICQRVPNGGTPIARTGPTLPSNVNCGTGWEDDPTSDSCFQFNIEQLTWDDAHAQCIVNGGDLVAITSIDKQRYLSGRTLSYDSDFFWIGANDKANERGYVWSNGAPFAFLHWDVRQPDNRQNADCVALVKQSGNWDDQQCQTRNGFICEKKGKTTYTPLPTTSPPAQIPDGQMWGCPRDWNDYRGSCYQAIAAPDGVDFLTASSMCTDSTRLSNLVAITDEAENQYVSSLIPQTFNGYVWIGLTDVNTEGTYVWSDGKTPVTYTRWRNGEPNDMNEEDCVVIQRSGGWTDFSCDSLVKYLICKKDKSLQPKAGSPEEQGCPSGSIGFGAQCYTFVETPKNYTQAQNDCKTRVASGVIGNLATVDNSQLNGFLTAELELHASSSYWIGLRQNYFGLRWQSGFTVDFTNWGMNHTGGTAERNTCVGMQKARPIGLWNNYNCSQNMSYICEAPRTGFTTPITLATTQRLRPCPKSWQSPQNSSYCFKTFTGNTTGLLSWMEAKSFCGKQATGGTLATITDSYLESWMITTIMGGDNATGTFWIGLNDRDVEAGYEWLDGSPFTYANWQDSQPDNFNSKEDCAEWVLPDNNWMDDYCYVSYNWICQIPRGSVIQTTLPPPTVSYNPECGNTSWVFYNNYCYFLSPDDGDMATATWFDANTLCKNMNADLASITGEDENGLLTSLITKTSTYSRWIGLNDLDVETYEWTDLSPISFVSWDVNEPNDAYGGEQCVEMTKEGYWNDNHCQSLLGYICKKHPGDFKPVTVQTTPASGGCPQSFSTLPRLNNCYYVGGTTGSTRANYSNAIEACKNAFRGGVLASVHSSLESKFIMTLVAAIPAYGFGGFGFGGPSFFGQVPRPNFGGQNSTGPGPGGWNSTGPGPGGRNSTGGGGRNSTGGGGRGGLFAGFGSIGGGGYAWIGLNDRKNESQFQWVDNSAVDFAAWGAGQPDENVNDNRPSSRRDCVAIGLGGRNAGLWNDRNCNIPSAYVCQVPRQPTAPTAAPNTTGCQTGYQRYLNKCYRYNSDRYNWTSAENFCIQDTANKGHLVSIGSRPEQAFVEIVTNRRNSTEFWIGMSYHEDISIYQWSDGWPVRFTNWGHDEPSAVGPQSCVTHTVDGQWHDETCDQRFSFVCEISLVQPPTPRTNFTGARCPDRSWRYYQGNCYRIDSRNPKSWSGASYACSILGGALVSVHSDDEARFLTNYLGPLGNDVWIGLQKGQGTGFSWSDGTEVEYTYWSAGEPSDPESNLHQDCVKASSGDGTWSDVDCFDLHAYLCKTAANYNTSSAIGPNNPNNPVTSGSGSGGTGTNKPVTTFTNKPVTNKPGQLVTLPGGATYPNGNPGQLKSGDSDSGLSGGAVTGIVFAVLAIVALCGVAGFIGYRRYNALPFLPKKLVPAGFDNATFNNQEGEDKERIDFSDA